MVLNNLPKYLVDMVRRDPPEGCHVIAGSTPVISFGNFRNAIVASLGINPSWNEFSDQPFGALLRNSERRLATVESLAFRGTTLTELSVEQVTTVVDDCNNYFADHRSPFKRWFNPLDSLLRKSFGVSYYSGTACHLDLIQWATNRIWSELPPRACRTLLDDGIPQLSVQLKNGSPRLLVLNGRSVIGAVLERQLARLEIFATLPIGQTSCKVDSGTGQGILFVGWSTNLQSSFGVSNEFKDALSRCVRERVDRMLP